MRAKKKLAQHFLNNDYIAHKIVESLDYNKNVLEIGPGKGILTKYLLTKNFEKFLCVEIDPEAIEYLEKTYPTISNHIINDDIIKVNFQELFYEENFSVIGNIPYNITGPIFFKILEYYNKIDQAVLMIQKEVALRIAAEPNSKIYGILSVLIQTFYDVKILFNVSAENFSPKPKVESTVIKLTKKTIIPPINNFNLYKKIVKTAFNQRRKMLRNSLSSFQLNIIPEKYLTLRAEQLSKEDYYTIYKIFEDANS